MLSNVIGRTTVLIAYQDSAVSTLRYGVMFWGNATNSHVNVKKKSFRNRICRLKRKDSSNHIVKIFDYVHL